MKLKTTYEATGLVLGNLWGGGKAAYPAAKLEGPNRTALLIEAETRLANGSLDSGMGFESLCGALLEIGQSTFVTLNGKLFVNIEFENIFIGPLSEQDKDFLETVLDN